MTELKKLKKQLERDQDSLHAEYTAGDWDFVKTQRLEHIELAIAAIETAMYEIDQADKLAVHGDNGR